MSAGNDSSLLAIDVGNSYVKFAWYPAPIDCPSEVKPGGLPITTSQMIEPELTRAFSCDALSKRGFASELQDWLEALPATHLRCYLASVHREAADLVVEQLSRNSVGEPRVLTAADLPIEARVEDLQKVGIDRLLSAVAANRVRERKRPAVVVSLGTACTVNLIAADGAFEGGAILPGIGLSAVALHTETSALPLVAIEDIKAPTDAIGKSTETAISSGLFWGLIGAVRELIDRMGKQSSQTPQIFLTGGEAPRLLENLDDFDGAIYHAPNMVLTGIQIAAGALE